MPNITYKNAYNIINKHKQEIFTQNFMQSKIEIFNSADYMKWYTVYDEFLDELFLKQEYKKNESDIFIRVKILDSFYSTNLKEGTDDMVHNIKYIKNFIKRIKKGDLSLINDISNVKSNRHKTKNSKELKDSKDKRDSKNSTSFASKYCNRYNDKKFPIYDKYVRQMLVLINKVTNFNDGKLTLSQISDYKEYCKIIDKFIERFNKLNRDQTMDYKLFDRYIWTWAKEIIHNIENKK